MQKTNSRVSRRGFMRAAGLGAASSALGAVTVSAASAQTKKWDREFDVVIVGTGGAALAGAIAASEKGASVALLEKAQLTGGTTAKSGGGLWVPNNHHMQALGMADDKETFMRYCAKVSYPESYNERSATYGMSQLNFDVLSKFYDRASEVIKHMDDTGAFPTTIAKDWKGEPGNYDYQSQLPENGLIRGRQVSPRVSADGKEGRGSDLVIFMEDYVLARGAEIMTEHRVTKIVREEGGRVIGVIAETPAGTVSFKANKGVIFGTGGFTHNKEMAANYLRNPIMGGCAVPSNEGDLILMASEVGVKMGAMQEAWNQQVILEQVLEFSSVPSGVFFLGGDSMIAVNKNGERMYDEKHIYAERARSHGVYDQWTCEYPNLYQIMLWDEKANEFGGMVLPRPGAELPAHIVKADSLEELAAAIQLRFDALADRIGTYKLSENFLETLNETIATFNGFAETGKDLDFHRGEIPVSHFFHAVPIDRGLPNPYMAPISPEGPYYATLLASGTLDTKGGPMFDTYGRAISTQDTPIEGLYVAGNCAASPSGKSYLGAGGTLGLGIVYGYIAGEHAASQE